MPQQVSIPQPIASVATDQPYPALPPGAKLIDSASSAPMSLPPLPPGARMIGSSANAAPAPSPVDQALASVPRPKAPAMDPVPTSFLATHGKTREALLGASAGVGAAETPNSLKDTATGAAKLFAIGPNEGETDPISKTMSYVPVLGPLYRAINGTLQNVNQAGGDIGEGLYRGAHGNPEGYEQAAHGAGQLGTSFLGAVLGGRGTGEAATPEILRKAAGVASDTVMSPERKMMAGGRPSVAEPNFEQDVKTAAPRLAEQQRIKPAKSAADVADMAHTAADKLWKDEVEPQIGRHADETIDGKAIAQQIRGSVDEGTRDLFPKEAETADDFAKKFDGPLTLDKANSYLKAINAQLKSFYRMSPEAQHAAGVTSGRISSLEGAADNLRDQMYQKLDDLGEQNPRGIRQEYGALKNVQRVFGKSATVAGRQPLLDLPTKLSMLAGASEAALATAHGNPVGGFAAGIGTPAMALLMKHLNGRDFMSSSGMAGLERANPATATPIPNLRLTPPPGTVPPSLVRQMPLALEENHPGQQPFARVGGENVPGEDLKLTPPPGEMPADAQRPLPITEPPAVEPRKVYPGQANGGSTAPKTPPASPGSAPKGGGGKPSGSPSVADIANDFLAQLKKSAKTPAAEVETVNPEESRTNGSSESDASMEAQQVAKQDKAEGAKYYRVDTRSGKQTPLIGPRPGDVTPGPYDVIVRRSPAGNMELSSGARARRYDLK